jgi:hypothetical protein
MWFSDAAVEVYRGNGIIIMDVRAAFGRMKSPWRQRPVANVNGLVVHHKATFNSYHAMQRNNVLARYKAAPAKRHDRIAYTFGVQHEPEVIDGHVVIYQFNALEAVSWHSGSKGKDSARFTNWRREQGPGRGANDYTVGLNLHGYFASRGHAPNHPETPDATASKQGHGHLLIAEPSVEQCRAVWGLWRYLVEQHNATGLFGHLSTGKAACPGDTAMSLVHAIVDGLVSNERELERWLSGRDTVILPGGWPDSGFVEWHDYSTDIQTELVRLGYDLGKSGPNRDGVDGVWGQKSRFALMDFEEELGLLENGQPDLADLEALREA